MRVASDIGGTFTDLAHLDEVTCEVGMTKVATTPANFAEGVVETLCRAALRVPDTDFFVHGSTITINALTERKGVKTGLITTKQTYAFRLDTPVELVNYHVTALGRVAKPELKRLEGATGSLGDAYEGTRQVNVDELGFHEAVIYEREWLPVGAAVKRPAVVFPDQKLIRDEYGFLHIERRGGGE